MLCAGRLCEKAATCNKGRDASKDRPARRVLVGRTEGAGSRDIEVQ